MSKFLIVIFGTLLFAFQSGNSQTLDNAVRISTLDHTGTARYMGAGGAMTALGADYSSSAYNPAGLALIRRSELVFTPVLFTSNSTSNWSGDQATDRFTNLQFTNVGLVLSAPIEGSSFTNFSFAVGYNRLANFHGNIFSNTRSEGNILDRFIALGEGLPPDQIDDFEVGLAYDVFAIEYSNTTESYFNYLEEGTELDKEYTIRNSGSINEVYLSFAGNLEEKLMLGLTLSMPIVSITEDNIYRDEDSEGDSPIYRSFEFTEYGEVSGVGFQLKAGLIYRHSQALRLGLAIHSPGWFSLSDEFYNSATFDFNPDEDGSGILPPSPPQSDESPVGNFDYNFTSAWRVMSGIGYLIGNSGFLSFDVEYLDYSSSRYNFTRRNSNDFLSAERSQNNQIERNLGSALNFRIGAEWAIDAFRLRGGLQFIQNAFEVDDDRDMVWSLGAGIRSDNFFMDLAYQRSTVENAWNPYTVPGKEEQPTIFNEFAISRVALTAGFKF